MKASIYGKGRPVRDKFTEGVESAFQGRRLGTERAWKAQSIRSARQHEQMSRLSDILKQAGIDLAGINSIFQPRDGIGRKGSKQPSPEPVKRPRSLRGGIAQSGGGILWNTLGEGLATDSLGISRGPLYDYNDSWNALKNIDHPDHREDASQDGILLVEAYTNPNQGSLGTGIAFVGIYFSAPTKNGVLSVTSMPSYNAASYVEANWGHDCHTEGWIGLSVQEYDATDHSFVRTLVNKTNSLFYEKTNWNTGDSNSYNSSGDAIDSGDFPVDDNHFYRIFVTCGYNINADGWSGFGGSEAHAKIEVVVPSINLAYFG